MDKSGGKRALLAAASLIGLLALSGPALAEGADEAPNPERDARGEPQQGARDADDEGLLAEFPRHARASESGRAQHGEFSLIQHGNLLRGPGAATPNIASTARWHSRLLSANGKAGETPAVDTQLSPSPQRQGAARMHALLVCNQVYAISPFQRPQRHLVFIMHPTPPHKSLARSAAMSLKIRVACTASNMV